MASKNRWAAWHGWAWARGSVARLGLALLLFVAAAPAQAAHAGRTVSPWANWADTLFQHIGLEQGLPHAVVTALAQDASGFLWVGTQGGLARWDGYRFRVYQPELNNPHSLPDNNVFCLLRDRAGRLWVGTNGGLARYDPIGDRFVRVVQGPNGVGHNAIYALADDGANGLWVGTQGGLDHLLPGTGRARHWQHEANNPASLPSDVIRSLLQDGRGRLWIGTRKGLVLRDGETMLAVPLPDVAEPLISSLMQASDGRIWIGTVGHGAFVVLPGQARAQAWPIAGETTGATAWGAAGGTVVDGADSRKDVVTHMLDVSQGVVWLATFGQGVLVWNQASGSLRRIRHEPGVATSVADNNVAAGMVDRSGLVWLGSQHGLSQHDPGQTALYNLIGGGSLLRDTDVTSIAQLGDGALWLGLQSKGIQIIDPRRGRNQWLRPDAQHPETALQPVEVRQIVGPRSVGPRSVGQGHVAEQGQEPGPGQGQGQGHGATESLNRDQSVFIATTRGLYRADLSGQQLHRVQLDQRPAHLSLSSVLPEGDHLWLGGIDGLWRVQLQPGAVLPATRVANVPELAREVIEVLEPGRDGVLWIGTRSHGLYRFDPQAAQPLRHIGPEPARAAGLASGFVSTLLYDSKGRLWIGTQGGGVALLRQPDAPGAPALVRIGLEQGLPNGLVDKLLEDGTGQIWASTDGGLAMIDPETLAVQRLLRTDGAIIPVYWSNAGTRSADGELLFGGNGGLTVVHPERLRQWTYLPPLVVSHLELGGKPVASSHLNRSGRIEGVVQSDVQSATQSVTQSVPQIEVAAGANSFALEFAALDYSDPGRNRYAYRLEGYDDHWIDSARRLAAYTNLPPGDYRLLLRGSNRIGAWANPDLVVPLRVLPFWYQTWWFRVASLLSLLLLALLLVSALVRWRTRVWRRQQQVLEAQVAERTSQLRQLGALGRDITANLDAEIVFRSLYLSVDRMLDASTLMVYRINHERATLDLAFGHDDGQFLPPESIPLDSPLSVSVRAVRERREILIELEPETTLPSHVPGSRPTLTALFVPLIVDDAVLGVMSVQSEQQHAYGEREQMIIRTLSAYGAIALANAAAIAALHQAQAQLVQQEKLASLGGLVAGIAHEINTPLGNTMVALSGVARAWQELQLGLAEGKISKSALQRLSGDGMEYTTLAQQTASRVAQLVTSFQAVAVRFDSDQWQELDLALYLPELAALVQPQIEAAGGRVEVATPPSLPWWGIAEALTEALSRILQNVPDHAFGGQAFTGQATPCLRLTASYVGAHELQIEVSDNGCGIAPADLPKVFDPFFTTQAGSGGHIGLGLHVAYNHITERLKGKISIQSRVGQGTTVTIRLNTKKPPDNARAV
jgi:ligand-binding sensor domain-containing protein/signal transduction histidine kinase